MGEAAVERDALREITVNGDRYYLADDVERWHRGLTDGVDRAQALEEENESLRETVARMTSEVFDAA